MSVASSFVGVVIPTIGRPSLAATLAPLVASREELSVVLVDDRRSPRTPLALPDELRARAVIVRSGGRGPAAARNCGWHALRSEWVAFLDDDVVPSPEWVRDLIADLGGVPESVVGVSGRVDVPLPAGRRPTDWERNVAGLATARYITADLAYRRCALVAVDGFDERFPRAFREDAELALRLCARGRSIVMGERRVTHPVRPAGPFVSVRLQRGNADDALMRALHGRDWHQRAGAEVGRIGRHGLITGAALLAGAALVGRKRRLARAAAAAWALGTAEFATARIAPGPRDAREVATMLATSVAIPPVACSHRVLGACRARTLVRVAAPEPPAPVRAILFDRDGTLVHDVAYNGDPARVEPVAGARAALDTARSAGLQIGLVTNQSGIARKLITPDQVDAVNARVSELCGGFAVVAVCPHGDADGCCCRKPAPGLVVAAADALGVTPDRCIVIGDIGADVGAAQAAGARCVLVPTPLTRPEEIASAPAVAFTLAAAIELVLAWSTTSVERIARRLEPSSEAGEARETSRGALADRAGAAHRHVRHGVLPARGRRARR